MPVPECWDEIVIENVNPDFEATRELSCEEEEVAIADDDLFDVEYGVGDGERDGGEFEHLVLGVPKPQIAKYVTVTCTARTQKDGKKEREEEERKEREEKEKGKIQRLMSLVGWVGAKAQCTNTGDHNTVGFPSLSFSKKTSTKKQPKAKAHSVTTVPTKIVEKFNLFNMSYREQTKRVMVPQNPNQATQSIERTKMCQSVEMKVPCPHGSRCRFAHNFDELVIRACMNGEACRCIRYENEKVENSRGDKICKFMHPAETREDYNIRVAGKRVSPTRTFGVKKTEKKIAKVEKKIAKVEKKTPEEYRNEKKEREERAIARFAEKQHDNEMRRKEQEASFKLILDLDTASFYTKDWCDATPTPIVSAPTTPTPVVPVTTLAPIVSVPTPVVPITMPIVSTLTPIIPVTTSKNPMIRLNQPIVMNQIKLVTPSKPVEVKVEPVYKSDAVCRTVEAGEQCKYGVRCRFAHFIDEFNPRPCNFGKMCRFVTFDEKTKTFSNTNTDRVCSFKHGEETRDNYFVRVKTYNLVPKNKNTPAPKPEPKVTIVAPKITEHVAILKATPMSKVWSDVVVGVEKQKEEKVVRVVKIPMGAKCLAKKPKHDEPIKYTPIRIRAPKPIEPNQEPVDAPNSAFDTPIVETPIVETPIIDNTPVVETPTVETPTVETPTVETPTVETPIVETPTVETPTVEAPIVDNTFIVVDAPIAAPIVDNIPIVLKHTDAPKTKQTVKNVHFHFHQACTLCPMCMSITIEKIKRSVSLQKHQ